MNGQIEYVSCHSYMMLPGRGRRQKLLREYPRDRQFVATEHRKGDGVAYAVNDHRTILVNGRDGFVILIDYPELEGAIAKTNGRPFVQILLSIECRLNLDDQLRGPAKVVVWIDRFEPAAEDGSHIGSHSCELEGKLHADFGERFRLTLEQPAQPHLGPPMARLGPRHSDHFAMT